MTLGERLVALRNERGWTRYRAAQNCQMSQTSYDKIEAGQTTNPGADVLRRLATGFEVSLDELAGEATAKAGRDHDAPRAERTVDLALRAVAAGGPPIEFVESPDEHYSVLRHLATKDRYVIRITGDSMFPTFHSGDLLLVEPAMKVRDGSPAIVLVRGETTVKRVYKSKRGGYILKSDSSTVPPMEEDAEDVEIKGRILRIVDGVRQ